MKFFAAVALGCAMVGAASAASALEQNDIFNMALLNTLETDEAMTAEWNAAEPHEVEFA